MQQSQPSPVKGEGILGVGEGNAVMVQCAKSPMLKPDTTKENAMTASNETNVVVWYDYT